MNDVPTRVAIIGIGWMGEYYVEAYSKRPDVEIVAIVESNSERRSAFATRYSVAASYGDAEAMLRDMVPDVVAVITPTKYFKEIVVACVEAGVKGVSVEKPIGGVLSDVDEMVDLCESRGVVFAGGRVQRMIKEVQQVASGIRAREYGKIIGASVHNWGGGTEISGGGNQHISVLRLLANAEVTEVIAWGKPEDALSGNTDLGLTMNGLFGLSNGIDCPSSAWTLRSGALTAACRCGAIMPSSGPTHSLRPRFSWASTTMARESRTRPPGNPARTRRARWTD